MKRLRVAAETVVPNEIKHEWKVGPRPGSPSDLNRTVYRCAPCGMWTANLPLYKDDICPAKERRKASVQRRVVDQ